MRAQHRAGDRAGRAGGAEDGAARAKTRLLLVLPADHVIRDVTAFQHGHAYRRRCCAEKGKLATFGVVPRTPETGYGYIRRGESLGSAQRIAQFVEKPSLERAQQFIASGDHYWNSGMFIYRAPHYLDELAPPAPKIAKVVARLSTWAQATIASVPPRRPEALRHLPERLHRLRRDGNDRRRRRRAARSRLVPTWS